MRGVDQLVVVRSVTRSFPVKFAIDLLYSALFSEKFQARLPAGSRA